MKKIILNLQVIAIIVAWFSVQQTTFAKSWKFKKATLSYVDLSDGAVITAQPVKTERIKLKKSKSTDVAITVNLNSIVHKDLSGIGGAFNEQGGEAFMTLPESKRKALAEAIFSPTNGAGFSLCRTAVGASDFGLSAYSYSETPEDYDMKHFSIKRDTKSVIPFILAAKAENPELKMFASPWSPPGWMKVSGKMDGGDKSPSTNVLKSDPDIYKAYGLYFSKYIQAYAKTGVIIDRLVVQNEPDMNPKYPGCDMLPKQMAELISDYIKPQFAKDGVKAEVWAGSFRGKRSDAQKFMTLKNAKDADGVGLQYAGPNVMQELRDNYPDLSLMHTEGRCENGKNSMDQARKRFGEIAMWINSGVENYCYWNMVLNETSSSGWGWKQNSLINIDRNTGEVTYNPDYAPVNLLSRYIRPGDQCLKVETTDGETALAVQNESRLVVFVQNNENTTRTKQLKFGEKVYDAEIPAQSLCALVFKN
jgi:glucosylceramidase